MPWLNRVDVPWLVELLRALSRRARCRGPRPVGGLADFLLRRLHAEGQLDRRRLHRHAVDGFPACGRPDEVLAFHALDGESLAARIGGRPR